jgi:plasmid stability protein
MPDILIRGVSQQLLLRLKARAKRNGRSLQSEVKIILERATEEPLFMAMENAGGWRKKLGRKFSDSVDLVREDRER